VSSSPRLLGASESLSASGSFAECAQCRPSSDLEVDLELLVPDDSDLDEVDPVDAGNLVNGEPWGWLRGHNRWWLVPLDLRTNCRLIAAMSVRNEGSMFGGPKSIWASYRAPVTAIWHADFDEPETNWLEVMYDAEPAESARQCFEWFADNTFCPGCEEAPGLVADVWVDEELAPGADQVGWAAVWTACRSHSSGCTDGYVKWSGQRWSYADGVTPPRRPARG
jgi:hypothetical protein